MSTQFARKKAAQAWCKEKTKHLTMQPELAEAFADILDEIWQKAWLGNATTGKLLAELQARAELGGYIDYKTTGEKSE